MGRLVIDRLAVLELSDDPTQRLQLPSARLTLRRAWPRSADHLLLEYVTTDGGLVPGQWMRDARSLQRIADETTDRCPRAPSLLVRTEYACILLQPRGADRRLIGLSELLSRPASTLLAHRPERRAVVRLNGATGQRYAKVVRPSRVRHVVESAECLRGRLARPFAVPEVLEVDESRGVVMFAVLPGVRLHELLDAGERFIDSARAVGEALRWFHAEAPSAAQGHDAQAEIRVLQKSLGHLKAYGPTLYSQLRDAPAGVLETLAKDASPWTLIHGDFYDKQAVLDPEGGVGILDLDTIAVGEAALDVGNMLAHLELRALQGRCSHEVASRAAGAFLDGYDPPPEVRARVPAYTDASRLRLACLYAFRPRWRQLLSGLVSRIGVHSWRSSPRELSTAHPRKASNTIMDQSSPSSETIEYPIGSVTQNPYLFIVGCPRSGTTLLERMVNAHQQIAIIHETHWIARYFKKRTGLTPQGLVTPELISKLSENHRFPHLKISRNDLEKLIESGEPISYANFVSRIFDLYGQREGKRIVGDKTTGGYLRNLPLLHTLWPKARFVHLIRDGRDVCLSMLEWPKAHRAAGRLATWQEDPVATTALWWKWQVRLGVDGGSSIGPDLYYEMRYESLVQHPADQCAALCSFLGLRYDDAMPKFHVGRTQTDRGLSANRAWLPPTPRLRDWRTQMAERDVELFEAIAGDLLSILGYERAFNTISTNIAEVAKRFRR